jgi:hypothetical protein
MRASAGSRMKGLNPIFRWLFKQPFPFRIPISRDADYYRSRLLQVHANSIESRAGFIRNLLLGNAGGLVLIAALLNKWPESKALIQTLAPSAICFAVGVGASAACGLFVTGLNHQEIAYLAHRMRLIDTGAASHIEWSEILARIHRVGRRLRPFYKRLPIFFMATLTVGYFGFVLGITSAIVLILNFAPSSPRKVGDDIASPQQIERKNPGVGVARPSNPDPHPTSSAALAAHQPPPNVVGHSVRP